MAAYGESSGDDVSRRLVRVATVVVVATLIGGCGDSGPERPPGASRVLAHVGDQRQSIQRLGRCSVPAPWDFKDCLKRTYPRSSVAALRDGQTVREFRLTWSPPAGLVLARLYRVADGERQRVGQWQEAGHMIDSGYVSSYIFRDPRYSRLDLRAANTLWVVLVGDDAGRGFEIALPSLAERDDRRAVAH